MWESHVYRHATFPEHFRALQHDLLSNGCGNFIRLRTVKGQGTHCWLLAGQSGMPWVKCHRRDLALLYLEKEYCQGTTDGDWSM